MRPNLRPLLITLLLVLSLPACGVRFADSFDGTELFKGIRMEGERVVDAPLTVVLTVTQGYPAPVRILCVYEDDDHLTEDQMKVAFSERAIQIGEQVLPAAPGENPGDEDLPEAELRFNFTVPQAGDYFLACFTPAADDNGLSMSFDIRAP